MTAPRALAVADRRRRVMALRLSGMEFEEVATVIKAEHRASANYTLQHAYRDLRIELAELRTLDENQREEARQLEVARLDVMLKKLWDEYEAAAVSTPSKALGETQGPALWIVDRILKLQDRRAKYLGLDAPTKHEVKLDDSMIGTVVDRLFAVLERHVTDNTVLSLIATDLRAIDWSGRAIPIPALGPGDDGDVLD